MERDQEEGRGRSPRRGAVVDIGRRGEGGRSVPLAASDPELEAQVVGAILSDNLLLRRIPFLTPDHFSDEINAKLWRIACEMINSGRRAVPVTVSAALGGTAGEAGAVSFLSSLAELGRLIGPAIPDAAERLRSLSQTRILADIRDEIGRSIASGSVHPDEALSAVLRRARAAIESGRDTSRGKREVAAAAIGEALIPRDPVTTGIQGLDFLMHGGLIRRRLYGIGGLTGRGKTILLGTVSDNLNARDDKHLVISLETPPEDFELRSCAKHLRINASAILDPDSPRHDAFARNAERYVEAIPDNTRYEYLPGGTMDQIHRCILRAIHKDGVQGFVLDYWQLIRGQEKGVSREAHLNDCADRLAAICRTENVWGVVTAQTDNFGKLRWAEGLAISCALYMRLVREENDDAAWFVTEKSNYTRYADTGTAEAPSMLFDQVGPHFRDLGAEDHSFLSGRGQREDDA